MNILILHWVRFIDILYDQAIDHEKHHVYYIGLKEKLADIPQDLRCTRIERAGERPVYDEVLEAVLALNVKFDHILSVNEFELMDAAHLRQRLGVPGPTPEQVLKVRDKPVMKRCVEQYGIRNPQFATLDQWYNGADLAIAEDKHVILKPIDGASSVNVVRFDSQRALREAIETHQTGIAAVDKMETGQWSGYEVDEFIEGPVLHIDGIVKNGEIKILIPSQYINTLLDFANGIPAGSVQLELTPALEAWTAKILEAVEITQGAFHLEAIDSPDGLVFLEIAHRVGGARIADTFSLKAGIHPSIAEFGVLIEPEFEPQPQWDDEHMYGWFIVPAHHLGTDYCHMTGHEFLADCPEAYVINQLQPGQPVLKRISYKEVDLPLAGIIRGQNSSRVKAVVEQLFSRLRLTGVDAPPLEAVNE